MATPISSSAPRSVVVPSFTTIPAVASPEAVDSMDAAVSPVTGADLAAVQAAFKATVGAADGGVIGGPVQEGYTTQQLMDGLEVGLRQITNLTSDGSDGVWHEGEALKMGATEFSPEFRIESTGSGRELVISSPGTGAPDTRIPLGFHVTPDEVVNQVLNHYAYSGRDSAYTYAASQVKEIRSALNGATAASSADYDGAYAFPDGTGYLVGYGEFSPTVRFAHNAQGDLTATIYSGSGKAEPEEPTVLVFPSPIMDGQIRHALLGAFWGGEKAIALEGAVNAIAKLSVLEGDGVVSANPDGSIEVGYGEWTSTYQVIGDQLVITPGSQAAMPVGTKTVIELGKDATADDVIKAIFSRGEASSLKAFRSAVAERMGDVELLADGSFAAFESTWSLVRKEDGVYVKAAFPGGEREVSVGTNPTKQQIRDAVASI
jgi:hypothetical protein